MPARRRALTPALLAANRQNARKSTGPRTPAGKARSRWNALKHPRYTHPHLQTLYRLGEDPWEYVHLLRETMQSYPPANPLQRMLVEDLVGLRWDRHRIQRAKEAKLTKRLQDWEHEQCRRVAELDQESSNIPQAEVLESGLRRAKDSPAKFHELIQIMEALEKIVDRGEFTEDNSEILFALWGKNPTLRGAQIIGLFEHFCKQGWFPAEGDREMTDRQEPAGEKEGDTSYLPGPRQVPPAPDGCATGETGTAQTHDRGEDPEMQEARGLYAGLKMALAEEFRDVLEEYELYMAEHSDRTRAARDACLAPCEDGEWSMLLRWESLIDREIERKVKLYFLMQTQDRRTKREEMEALIKFSGTKPSTY